MREIKFRGKRLDNGKWVKGDLLIYQDGRAVIHSYMQGCRVADDVDPESVGQHTGLTDKDGTEICEGDIVKGLFFYGVSVVSKVIFKDGSFGLEWNRGNVKEFFPFTSICNVSYEVIGNVYDNPELLKGAEE